MIFNKTITQNHCIYNFLGIKLKIKHGINKKHYKEFLKHKVQPNTILLIEVNNCHFETIPGYCKMLLTLGYNLEILCKDYSLNIFSILKNDNIQIYEYNTSTFDKILEDFDFSKYERIFYNSKIIYKRDPEEDIHQYYTKIPHGQKSNVYVQHHIDRINEYNDGKSIILANPAHNPSLSSSVVNSHYCGEIFDLKNKSQNTNFISIGELEIARRNPSLLINAVKTLHDKGIRNFKITVIGLGELEQLPVEIQPYFNILGRVDYPTMFEQLREADFILPLLDPSIDKHKRYMQDGTSGTFQLVYGFFKPCIIHKTFADIYDFNDNNSLIYESNDKFADAMQKAIDMKNEEYLSLQNAIKNQVQIIEKDSLENLKGILNG